MNKLVAAALEENPIGFKKEFEAQLKDRIDALVAQNKVEIAQSVRIDGEENNQEE